MFYRLNILYLFIDSQVFIDFDYLHVFLYIAPVGHRCPPARIGAFI